MISVDIKADRLFIRFDYDPALVSKVKTIPGRKFGTSPVPHWSAPVSLIAFQILNSIKSTQGTRYTEAASLRAIEVMSKGLPQTSKGKSVELDFPAELNYEAGEIKEYQKEGIQWLAANRGGCGLLADDMGLGKTLQAIGFLAFTPDAFPALVVVPASLKLNWQKEINKWLVRPRTIHVASGKTGAFPKADILIINYDIISEDIACPDCKGKGKVMGKTGQLVTCRKCAGKKKVISCRKGLAALRPKTVILDEAHAIKNSKNRRTPAVQALAKIPSVKYRIALTGTPVVNRPVEFFNTLNFVAPEQFDHFFRFAKRYCGAVQTRFGWDFTGATHTQELHELLTSTCMLRRLKKDVLKELPPKVRSVIPLEITNEREYQRAEEDLLGWLKENGADKKKLDAVERAEMLVKMEALKQLAVKGKISGVLSWIKDYFETEQKLVIFTTHQWTVDLLRDELAEYNPVVLDGRVPMMERKGAVEAFQNDPTKRPLIGNLRVASEGHTMTASRATCSVELGQTPGIHLQAEDRVNRIGQEADSISAYYLVAVGTIEEDICEMIDRKAKVTTKLLDGQEVQDSDLLTDLMRKMEKRTGISR